MADSQVMTCQPLRQSCSKFKIDFSDLFDEDEDDDRPPPPCPGLRSAEESSRIWKRRREGWAKDILEKKKNDDDDPEPSNSRTAIFRVRVPANANPNQDTSALTTYLGDQAGNTNMVEDILVGRSGAGGDKKNLYMKNDDVDRQTDVVVAVKEDIGEDTPPCLSSGENLSAAHQDSDISDSYNLNMGSRECEDDDPDPSVTRTDILLVCVPAITIQYQDASASSYLGDQAGNTNTVDRILVGISGAGSWIVWRSNRESQEMAGYLQGEPVGPFGGKLDGEGTRHKGAAGRGVYGESTRPPSRTL